MLEQLCTAQPEVLLRHSATLRKPSTAPYSDPSAVSRSSNYYSKLRSANQRGRETHSQRSVGSLQRLFHRFLVFELLVQSSNVYRIISKKMKQLSAFRIIGSDIKEMYTNERMKSHLTACWAIYHEISKMLQINLNGFCMSLLSVLNSNMHPQFGILIKRY